MTAKRTTAKSTLSSEGRQGDQELALLVLQRATLPGGVERKAKYNHSATAEYETAKGLVTIDVECNQHQPTVKKYFVSITITKQVDHHSEAVAFIDSKVREERIA